MLQHDCQATKSTKSTSVSVGNLANQEDLLRDLNSCAGYSVSKAPSYKGIPINRGISAWQISLCKVLENSCWRGNISPSWVSLPYTTHASCNDMTPDNLFCWQKLHNEWADPLQVTSWAALAIRVERIGLENRSIKPPYWRKSRHQPHSCL